MEKPLDLQLITAAAALLAGVGLGFLYDFFRVIRQRGGGAVLHILCDIIFCLLAAAALFLLGMGPGKGDLRVYMAPLAALGAGAYFVLFGAEARKILRLVFGLFDKIWSAMLAPLRMLLKMIKNSEENLKNSFSRVKKWFTIIHNNATSIAERRKTVSYGRMEGIADEAEKGKYFYQDSYSCSDSIRGSKSRKRAKPHGRGAGG